MVSNARLDLPEPERPVMTTSRSRGISTEMFLRLCTRAPCTATLARALGFAARLGGLGRLDPLEGIGSVSEIHERKLLDACGALLRESAGDRDLPDESLISEVLARRCHTVHVQVADEVVLDVAARSRFADLPQVIEHRGEQCVGAVGQIAVDRGQRSFDALPRLSRVEEVEVDGLEERRVEGERLRDHLAIDELPSADDLYLSETRRGVKNPERSVLEVASREEKLVRLVDRRQRVRRRAKELQLRVSLPDGLQPLAQCGDAVVVSVQQAPFRQKGMRERM